MQCTDAVVIGAGPVGLFQAFQLGLQGLSCHVVDALPEIGGQCMALYPDKPIYDIPGIPVCTGRELAQQLHAQLRPFATPIHLGQTACALEALPDGNGWVLSTDSGQQWQARSVVLAAGLGAFLPRQPPLPGLAAHIGQQLFYGDIPDAARSALAQQPGAWVVMGGEPVAVDTALTLLADAGARPVVLLHRTDRLVLPDGLQARLEQALGQGQLQLMVAQPTAIDTDANGRLSALRLATLAGETRLETACVLPRLGLAPQLEPMATWQLGLQRKRIPVDPVRMATDRDGLYAVGDLCDYPGKRKLIVCGFHEATLAAFAVREQLYPHERPLLQYTTTSPTLQQRLGLSAAA